MKQHQLPTPYTCCSPLFEVGTTTKLFPT